MQDLQHRTYIHTNTHTNINGIQDLIGSRSGTYYLVTAILYHGRTGRNITPADSQTYGKMDLIKIHVQMHQQWHILKENYR
ncbi:hypothetical protein BELL_0493g00040 [Botrytis elliptica]|uniref:Uncharacterized protein n=1 Tax=Botrytis elliptica TaxID=278938 RepID=A0A4Z1JF47_9HELO|nr:hypothetical protein BELL_0493g00040 [Botrytis elliptica]